MRILHALAAFSLLACSLATTPTPAAEPLKGSWTLSPTSQDGIVRFALMRRWNGNNMHHDSEWPLSAFQGLDYATPGRHDVTFAIDRDAGRLDCEGYLANGEGAGIFRFTAKPKYQANMAALGYDGIDDDKQFAMAMVDVSVDFARTVKTLNLRHLDTDKLVATRIFNVTPEFVHGMRAEGLSFDDADKVIAFRVHGATVEWVRELKKAGLALNENQLIAFRVHKVSPEYIAQIEKLGFSRPSADQLVAMRVHGVTPEFISEMKSRGLKNLTIDRLVSLRVHGIE